jgi:hypothetical protein
VNREEHVIHDTFKVKKNKKKVSISETSHRQTSTTELCGWTGRNSTLTRHKRLVAAGDKERSRARPSGSARRVREVGEREEPVGDRPVLGRRDPQEGGPSWRAGQRALVRAAQAPHRVLVDGDVAAPAVEAGGVLRRRRAVDGDLQAADDGAEEQREQDQAAVGLAGAPLRRIGRSQQSESSVEMMSDLG